MDLPFHRRNTRLENSWSNLEATRASCTGTNCRTGTNYRAEVQEGPLLHGVARPLDIGGFCNVHADMEIVRRRGCPPRFPFELFWEQQKAYDSGPEKHVWESLEDLERAAARESSATILGHIGAETAKKWLGWEHGELYTVGYRGECCFASTAEEWWSRRLCELSQGRAFFFSDVQEMHPKAGEGGGRRHARGSRTRSPLALRLPRLGKRELILVLFVCLFDLCLFGFVGFFFLLVSRKGCGL